MEVPVQLPYPPLGIGALISAPGASKWRMFAELEKHATESTAEVVRPPQTLVKPAASQDAPTLIADEMQAGEPMPSL